MKVTSLLVGLLLLGVVAGCSKRTQLSQLNQPTLPLGAAVGFVDVPESHKRAREIMGHNFFGVEEAVLHFGIDLETALEEFAEIPFTEGMLKYRSDSHVLVAVPRISIIGIRNQYPQLFRGKEGSGLYTYSFAHEVGESGWYLIRREAVTDREFLGLSKDPEKFSSYVIREKRKGMVLSARVAIFALIGHYIATGERLLPYSTGETTTTVIEKKQVLKLTRQISVGPFRDDGLGITKHEYFNVNAVIGFAPGQTGYDPEEPYAGL